ncbi:isoleucyl-tRNA synthetase, putative [Theileria equi strain WA]|uniref:isoleucine--tRNA ligase n=1 Tax=Theileria equi strain WA TaxID=1537102 RepID=L0AVB0_THEEQ|nr:isoleucyl-tRNA synthetase, putative [Theileria equi strain WA]AFZ79475.1 isoleucyl-tRNA synthetase, putative [Theileria equi strain WA]|eukprot:XP_004829141.1 isoleucyl-tRNA synthetase, putative [Theileria equi strain WA]
MRDVLLRFCIVLYTLSTYTGTFNSANVESVSFPRGNVHRDVYGGDTDFIIGKFNKLASNNGVISFISWPSGQYDNLKLKRLHTRDSTKSTFEVNSAVYSDKEDTRSNEKLQECEKGTKESLEDLCIYLPRNIWPFNADLDKAAIGRQILVQKHWEDKKVYENINAERIKCAVGVGATLDKILENTKIILDGPPFANGDAHFGHFLNKTIKDVLLRFFLLRGDIALMVPGWDCHGMPIEFKILNDPELCAPKEEKLLTEEQVKSIEIRNRCKAYAKQSIDSQMGAFKKSGIWALWDKHYATYHSFYEKLAVETFLRLERTGHIHKSLLPQHYSKLSKSVLADSEIVHEKRSIQTCYISFALENKEDIIGKIRNYTRKDQECDTLATDLMDIDSVKLIAYTTMGWTIIGNKGLAVNEKADYSIYKENNVAYIVSSTCKLFPFDKKICNIPGEFLKNLIYIDPVFKKKYKIYAENFVIPYRATGIMHMCPAHGIEDFLCISSDPQFHVDQIKLNDEYDYGSVYEDKTYRINNLIDENENFYKGIHYAVNGRNIEDIDERIMKIILGDNLFKIGNEEVYVDCDWRYKNRLHVRLTNQWVLDINDKAKLCKMLDSIKMYPSSSKNYLRNSILFRRANWCLSRQRVWGTPIPFLGNTSLCPDSTPDYEISDILYKKYMRKLHEPFSSGGLRPLPDILDVWFESALSELYTMKILKQELGKLHKGAPNETTEGYFGDISSMKLDVENLDIYAVEGRDQHRGWYQSTILLHSLLNLKPPFRHVITHGFVNDWKGKKFSKSAQKVKSSTSNVDSESKSDLGVNKDLMSAIGGVYYDDPEILRMDDVEAIGVDALRLWVCSNDFLQRDIELTKENIQGAKDFENKIVKTFRFLLGVMETTPRTRDFKLDFHANQMYDGLGFYFLHLLYEMSERAKDYYMEGKFYKVMRDVSIYTTLLSNIYISYLKNILYIQDQQSLPVKMAKRSLREIATVLLKIIAPIMPHLAEEVYAVIDRPKTYVMDCTTFEQMNSQKLQEDKIDRETLFTKRSARDSIFNTEWPQRQNFDSNKAPEINTNKNLSTDDKSPEPDNRESASDRRIMSVGTALTFKKMLNQIRGDCRREIVKVYIQDKELVDDMEYLQKVRILGNCIVCSGSWS